MHHNPRDHCSSLDLRDENFDCSTADSDVAVYSLLDDHEPFEVYLCSIHHHPRTTRKSKGIRSEENGESRRKNVIGGENSNGT